MGGPHFEGFEKRLEIEFMASANGDEECGLRGLSLLELEEILTAAQCTVVSGLSNVFFDSYVLSESSLFIYPLKMVIKTCGTTQLLKSIRPLLSHAAKLSLRVGRCRYSRGSFLFPAAQPFPHRSFREEVKFLDDHFPTLASKAYTLGNGNGNGDGNNLMRWHVYSAVVAEYWRKPLPPAYTLEVCMTELDKDVAVQFYKKPKPGNETANEMTVSSGIHTLLPTSQICDFAFDPCGYSMNSMELGAYSTIHITPEEGYSYASFEMMGYDPPALDLQHLLNRVAATFNPSTFSFSLYTNDPLPFNSWFSSTHPTAYHCQTATRQHLPAGVLVFHTFTKRNQLPLPLFPKEKEKEKEKEERASNNICCYRMWCGLDVAADGISSSAAAAAAAVDI